MRTWVAFAIAALSFSSARIARTNASELRAQEALERPYAPSPDSATIIGLGYRELFADVLYVRLVGYVSEYASEPAACAGISEAIAALDPYFRRPYELGAVAMTDARRPPDQALQLRAIRLLETGMSAFPTYWRFAKLAGEIYLVDLSTRDPRQRAAWDEVGALLLESASRMPNAPADTAVSASILRSRLGQTQRAIDSITEILLVTHDHAARDKLLAQLAKLTEDETGDIAAEILEQRYRFEREWKTVRGAVPDNFYLLLGPPLGQSFDLGDLATGGRDLIGSEGFERLEPLDDAPSSTDGSP